MIETSTAVKLFRLFIKTDIVYESSNGHMSRDESDNFSGTRYSWCETGELTSMCQFYKGLPSGRRCGWFKTGNLSYDYMMENGKWVADLMPRSYNIDSFKRNRMQDLGITNLQGVNYE